MQKGQRTFQCPGPSSFYVVLAVFLKDTLHQVEKVPIYSVFSVNLSKLGMGPER